MADDITLKMNVDITDAQSAINLFQKTAEKAFKSSNASTQSMGNSLTKTANNIQGLVARMRELENTRVPTQQYTNLQTTIANLSTQAQQARKELEQMEKTRPLTDKYAGVSSQLESVTAQLNKAKLELGRMNALGTVGGADWIKAKNDVAKYQQQVTYLQHALTGLEATGQKYEQSATWDKQAKKVQVYEQSLQSAKNQMTLLQQSGGAFMSGVNTAEYSKLSQQLAYAVNQGALLSQKINNSDTSAKNLVSTFKSFGTTISRAVSTTTHALSKLGTSSHSTSLLHNKSWKSMLTMVLKYAFGIRSIFLLYKKVRTVIKTGLTEMAKEFEDVRADVDGLKNSWSGFKASLVSAFQPIFSYVVPALTTLINYLTAAMNALANFFALLTGQSYYYKAKKGNESVANAIGGTGSAAEDANEELAEYDDLLVIDQDSGSGGGGGGGSSAGDAWNWEKVDVTASAWYEKLKKAFSNWDFTEIGTEIGNKLVDAMKKIPWDTIYSYASNFGKGLATFLNGLISTDLFSELGSTIAKALNTAFLFLNTFGKTFDWTEFGNSIGEGINSFFKDADFAMWGDTVHTWVGGILDAGIALLTTTDFEQIGEKLGEFLESIQVDDLFDKVKTLCSKIITAMGNAITGFKSTASEKTKLATAIGGLLGVLAITKSVPLTITFAVAIAGFKIGEMYYESATGETVNQSFIDELGDIAEGMFGDNKIEFDLADAITFVWQDLGGQHNPELNFWQRLLYGTLSSMFAPAMVVAQYGKIIIDLKDLVELKWSNLTGSEQKTLSAWSPVQYFLKPALDSMFSVASLKKTIHNVIDLANLIEIKWDMSKAKEKLKTMGENIPKGIKDGIKSYLATNPFVSLATTLWDKIVKPICTKFGIESPAKKMYEYGKNIFLGIVEGFKDKFTSIASTIQEFKDKLVSKITEKFSGIWDTIKSNIGDFSLSSLLGISEDNNVISITTSIMSTFSGALLSLVDFETLSSTWSTFKTNFRNVTNTIKSKFSGVFSAITDVDTLKTSWDNLVNVWKDIATTIKANLGGKIKEIIDLDTIKTKYTNLKNAWTDKTATLKSYVGGQISKIGDLDTWKSKFYNMWSNWKDGVATMTANVGGQISEITNLDTWKSTFDKLKSAWTGTKASFTTYFDTTQNTIDNWATAISNLASSWVSKTATFSLKFSAAADDLKSWVNTNVISKINNQFDKVPILKNHHIPLLARGGIVDTATMFVAGESGKEAIVPLERNLEWMDKMATAISNKIMDINIPGIVSGMVLPTNPQFSREEEQHNSNVEALLEALLIAVSDRPDIVVPVQINGREIAKAVAQENDKRNKQLGYV